MAKFFQSLDPTAQNTTFILNNFTYCLVNEWGVEPKVIMKANQFVSFKFRDVPLIDKLHSLGRARRLDSFLNTHKRSETKCYFPCERSDDPEKLNNTQFPRHETFFSKLCNNTYLEKDCSDFEIIIDGGLTSKEGSSKPKLKQPSATGQESS